MRISSKIKLIVKKFIYQSKIYADLDASQLKLDVQNSVQYVKENARKKLMIAIISINVKMAINQEVFINYKLGMSGVLIGCHPTLYTCEEIQDDFSNKELETLRIGKKLNRITILF
ncbi:unnamed protein product [Paramecium octaurelia]|uniref:Uncharacterized protein n=1 Tax=Paramecium octaurelia TaxID=43137 RepID=A0A8S1VBU6_PAROT|nr:unnamed protein product [Paramecium octaurelia]